MRKVLYIDDNQEFLDVVLCALKRTYQVYTCISLEAAEDYLKSNQDVQVIICDHHFSGTSGLEFCRKLFIQNHNATRVLVTGDMMIIDEIAESINQKIIFQVIFKPFSMEDFFSVIEASVQKYLSEKTSKKP